MTTCIAHYSLSRKLYYMRSLLDTFVEVRIRDRVDIKNNNAMNKLDKFTTIDCMICGEVYAGMHAEKNLRRHQRKRHDMWIRRITEENVRVSRSRIMMTEASPTTPATSMDLSPVSIQSIYENISDEDLPEVLRPPPISSDSRDG